MLHNGLAGPMLRVGEASRLLHVHENTLRRWSDLGLIRTYRIGHRGDRRFSQRDILYFLVTSGIYAGDVENSQVRSVLPDQTSTTANIPANSTTSKLSSTATRVPITHSLKQFQ